MLHLSTIESGTFSLLNRLMGLDILKDFSLVGGTALSLRYGHRSSVDLDFFCNSDFDGETIQNELAKEFSNDFYCESGHKKNGIFCYIKNIKVDIVHYPFVTISNIDVIQNIRFYGDADIAAMKIQAILGRGQKKDFWDLHELLHHYSLQQIIDWHKQKYPNQMLAISIPNAISYFVDAEESETPVSFKNQTWEGVKKFISQTVSDYLS